MLVAVNSLCPGDPTLPCNINALGYFLFMLSKLFIVAVTPSFKMIFTVFINSHLNFKLIPQIEHIVMYRLLENPINFHVAWGQYKIICLFVDSDA